MRGWFPRSFPIKNVTLAVFLMASISLLSNVPTLTRAAGGITQSTQAIERPSNAFFEGKALFLQKCGFCHGADAAGATGPDLLQSSLVLHDKDGNLIGPVVRGSRAGKGMPAFQFSDSQIRDIAAFLHETIKEDATVFYTNSTGKYAVKYLLVGNAHAGKAYFYGDGRCYQCHSVSGDLAHIASKYGLIDLERRIAYPSGTAPTIVVSLPGGEKVAGTEVYVDRFFLSLRDRVGWVHTYRRDRVSVKVRDPLSWHRAWLGKCTDRDLHNLFAFLETLK